MPCAVYLLTCGARSYVGCTVNLARRLRQHRGELRGGAKATRAWPYVRLELFIDGIPDFRTGLSLEWHAKRRRGRRGRRGRRAPRCTTTTTTTESNEKPHHWRVAHVLAALEHPKFVDTLMPQVQVISTRQAVGTACVAWRDAGSWPVTLRPFVGEAWPGVVPVLKVDSKSMGE